MYAVFESGGKQHRVVPGETLSLERLDAPIGSDISFDSVLMVSDQEKDEVKVGTPYVANCKVNARIVSHDRQPKIKVIKFKRRKNYLRRKGHKQHTTLVEITSIEHKGK
ncbi:MAG: 50S ribosomal protein L21 [Gammaproteobacteria bacterium]|nr:50S ribosomal protein L21 [Gammaproteobacteria bacterium]MYF38519.1 50S ribosomal protein L21 [Gammaproteobacteria bacterium]